MTLDTQSPREPLFRLSRALLRACSLLLPKGDRNDWFREWRAELEAEWLQRTRGGAFGFGGKISLLMRSAGSVFDIASYWLAAVAFSARDARNALRTFTRSPGVTIVSLMSLAIGIGANTAIFSALYGIVFQPLEYPDADRLVMVWEHPLDDPGTTHVISPRNFVDWQEQNTSFESMALFNTGGGVLGDTDPIRATGATVSGNYFELLGVRAALGRTLLPGEDGPDAPRIVVLSDRLWTRRFGADSGIVGQTVLLSGRQHEVVGVMPPGFRGPDHYAYGEAELWQPVRLDASKQSRAGRWFRSVARLRDGVSVEQAQAEMNTIANQLSAAFPEANEDMGVLVIPLHEDIIGDVRPILLILLATVGVVLLIACANVANLQLSRAVGRTHEFAVRAALGADRPRLLRQLFSENLVLALAGGALGVTIAVWGMRALLAWAPGLPRVELVSVNVPVLLFALGISVAAGFGFGLVPASSASSLDLHATLNETGRTGSQSRRRSRIRGGLVICEVALSLLLLMGAGLLAKSFRQLTAVDPGIDPRNVLTMRLNLPPTMARDERPIFLSTVLPQIEALPTVMSGGTVTTLPFHNLNNFSLGVEIEGRRDDPTEDTFAQYRAVTPGYFDAVSMSLTAGRWLDAADQPDGIPVIVVNQDLVDRYFDDTDPIGKTISFRYGSEFQGTIVGVVEGVRYYNLYTPPGPEIYLPYAQHPVQSPLFLTIQTTENPTAIARAVTEIIKVESPTLVVDEVAPFTQLVSLSLARQRIPMLLIGGFALIALLLAIMGLYAVMAHSVGQRNREVGIRMALGARSGQVVGLVIRDGLKLVVPGLVIGIVAAYWLLKFLSSLLYGVSSTDTATFVTVPAIVLAVTLTAAFFPARRASRVDPTESLRVE